MCHKCRGDRANHLYPSSISYYQNFEIVMDFYVLFDAIYSLRWSKTFFHIIFVFRNPCYFSMYKTKFFYPPVSYKTIFTFTLRQIGEKWTGKDANMRAQIKLHRGKEADRLVSGVGVQNQVCNRLQKIIDLSRIPSSCYCCVMCLCVCVFALCTVHCVHISDESRFTRSPCIFKWLMANLLKPRMWYERQIWF